MSSEGKNKGKWEEIKKGYSGGVKLYEEVARQRKRNYRIWRAMRLNKAYRDDFEKYIRGKGFDMEKSRLFLTEKEPQFWAWKYFEGRWRLNHPVDYKIKDPPGIEWILIVPPAVEELPDRDKELRWPDAVYLRYDPRRPWREIEKASKKAYKQAREYLGLPIGRSAGRDRIPSNIQALEIWEMKYDKKMSDDDIYFEIYGERPLEYSEEDENNLRKDLVTKGIPKEEIDEIVDQTFFSPEVLDKRGRTHKIKDKLKEAEALIDQVGYIKGMRDLL
jgi:hypothetical protein